MSSCSCHIRSGLALRRVQKLSIPPLGGRRFFGRSRRGHVRLPPANAIIMTCPRVLGRTMHRRSRLALVSVALVTILSLSSLTPGATIDTSGVARALPSSQADFGADNPLGPGPTDVTGVQTPVKTISVGSEPSAIAYDSANHCIYVANEGDLNVTVINGDTNSVVANIEVGGAPDGIAYDSATGDIYVANSLWSNFTIIDGATNEVVDWMPYTGVDPMGVAYDSSNGYIYAANWGTGNVTVISGDSVHSWITVGSNDSRPDGVDYDNSNGNIYVAVLGSNMVQDPSPGYLSVIHGATNSVANTLTAGSGPDAVADSGSSAEVYVANYYSHNVSVINAGNGSTQLGSIPVGYAPDAVAYDAFNHDIFVANEGSDNVTVIGTSDHVVGNIPVGQEPDALAYDSANGDIYVADYGSSSVSVIVPGQTYSVSFSETGLPSGANWSVTLNGTMQSSLTGSNLTFREPNGTFFFMLGSFPNYSAKPSLGDVRVLGANTTVSVVFYPIYTVTFRESGLPVGFEWNVTLNGTTENSTQRNATFKATNGTYPFATYWTGQNYRTGIFFQPHPLSGNVTVDGSNVTVAITFRSVYTTTWGESGLPNGTRWSMTVNGTTESAVVGGPIKYLTFFLTNGTYTVTVGAPAGYSARPATFPFIFQGPGSYPATQEDIAFYQIVQNVTFSGPSLPSGTVWFVNLTNGQSFSSGTSTVTFQEPDGTYYFTIGSTSKAFTPSPSSGSFTLNGTTSVSEVISFTAVPSSAPPSSFNLGGAILVAVLVVVAIGVSVAVVTRSRRKS